MICRKCREWAAKGAANCQACGRHCMQVMEWDKKMEKVKVFGGFLLVLFISVSLIVIGKILNRGLDKMMDGWGW